jgi:3D (Asp-Asp-Asp) domain-containing protein
MPYWQVVTAALGFFLVVVPAVAPRLSGASRVDAAPIDLTLGTRDLQATTVDHRDDGPTEPDVSIAPTKMTVVATAYCPCSKCCGKWSDNKTASGKPIWHNDGQFVAADTRLLPFFTKICVPGYYGETPVPVLDRGRKIKGRRIDVFFYSHEQARRWGSRTLEITILP